MRACDNIYLSAQNSFMPYHFTQIKVKILSWFLRKNLTWVDHIHSHSSKLVLTLSKPIKHQRFGFTNLSAWTTALPDIHKVFVLTFFRPQLKGKLIRQFLTTLSRRTTPLPHTYSILTLLSLSFIAVLITSYGFVFCFPYLFALL